VEGEPWMFVARDVLMNDKTLQDAKESITRAKRTCNLILGVGDGKENRVTGVEYSGRLRPPNFYADTNLLPVNDTWHPVVENVVYNGMDWLCPTYNLKLSEQLQKYHGQIDEVTTITNILPSLQSGSLHVAFYDLTQLIMYVAFHYVGDNAKDTTDEPMFAYERQFTQLNMSQLFEEEQPTFVV